MRVVRVMKSAVGGAGGTRLPARFRRPPSAFGLPQFACCIPHSAFDAGGRS
jgi:hypothetical protein